MTNEQLKCLVKEYRLVEKRLNEIRAKDIKIQISLEISRDLEKALLNELENAQQSKDSSEAECWQQIINNYFHNDKDRPSAEDDKRAKEKISGDNERLVMYYEKKLQVIEKLLGSRLAEILESYEQKNILMGNESSSGRLFHEIQGEEEEKEARSQEKKKKNITFDKL
ncbi:MAG: hypothetical protein NG737_05530 [Omnitrophica bacterium]|nr:hypothetical protein [Candidatus Omnitrophota bacterium]